MPALAENLIAVVGTLLLLAFSFWASAHAILHKREVHASISWAALIWLAPGVGALAYVLLGRNRIQRRAVELRGTAARVRSTLDVPAVASSAVNAALGGGSAQLGALARLIEEATGRPLLPGNHVLPLLDGDAAYPEMLRAIESAERSIALSTYIFENSPIGRRFVDALCAARARGLQVRVLLDDVGRLYSFPHVHGALRAGGVKVGRFLPAWRAPYFNLRNHRKLLVCDGCVGFTGGMNIRAGHVLSDRPRYPIRDLHFRVDGPVVAQLMEAFAEDWEFTTRESLRGELWFAPLHARGDSLARAIPDGPDQDLDKVRWAFLGAIACAERSIRVLTPYFLPDLTVATAFNVAAMRGVRVDIALPQRGNLPVVQWAMWGHYAKLLGHGCRLWLTPPPFDHSKLMVVDDIWCMFGSPNWDPRSLRLNFEIGVECYDARLAAQLGRLFDERVAAARELTREDVELRPLSLRLRDGIARLLTPYL